MMGPKTGFSTQTKERCPMAMPNHCTCHGSNLPIRGLFRDLPFVDSWYSKTIDMLRFIKSSPKRENMLASIKEKAPLDKLSDRVSDTPKLINWNPTRWTENKKCFSVMKFNLPHVEESCEICSDSRVTSDSVTRNRSVTHRNNVCEFSYMRLLFLCVDFIGLVDSMSESFQDPKNGVSICAKIANNVMTVLKQSRTNDDFDRFYDVDFRYCDMRNCVTNPEVLIDIQRRRKRRNYKDLLNYFVVEGYGGKDTSEKHLHAAIKEKNKFKVIVGNEFVTCDTPI